MTHSLLLAGIAVVATLSAAPALAGPTSAQANTAAVGNGNGQDQAVRDWTTNAFAAHPPANTNAFAARPSANTNAFATHPPANTRALGTAPGQSATAFGKPGERVDAFGNQPRAANNAGRIASSFGTGTDHGLSPVGNHNPGTR